MNLHGFLLERSNAELQDIAAGLRLAYGGNKAQLVRRIEATEANPYDILLLLHRTSLQQLSAVRGLAVSRGKDSLLSTLIKKRILREPEAQLVDFLVRKIPEHVEIYFPLIGLVSSRESIGPLGELLRSCDDRHARDLARRMARIDASSCCATLTSNVVGGSPRACKAAILGLEAAMRLLRSAKVIEGALSARRPELQARRSLIESAMKGSWDGAPQTHEILQALWKADIAPAQERQMAQMSEQIDELRDAMKRGLAGAAKGREVRGDLRHVRQATDRIETDTKDVKRELAATARREEIRGDLRRVHETAGRIEATTEEIKENLRQVAGQLAEIRDEVKRSPDDVVAALRTVAKDKSIKITLRLRIWSDLRKVSKMVEFAQKVDFLLKVVPTYGPYVVLALNVALKALG